MEINTLQVEPVSPDEHAHNYQRVPNAERTDGLRFACAMYRCKCRRCPQCKRYWLADVRMAGHEGMPRVEKCDDCHAQDRIAHPRLSHACQYTNHNHCSGCVCVCHARAHLDNRAACFAS